jgi:hypothetical protein
LNFSILNHSYRNKKLLCRKAQELFVSGSKILQRPSKKLSFREKSKNEPTDFYPESFKISFTNFAAPECQTYSLAGCPGLRLQAAKL